MGRTVVLLNIRTREQMLLTGDGHLLQGPPLSPAPCEIRPGDQLLVIDPFEDPALSFDSGKPPMREVRRVWIDGKALRAGGEMSEKAPPYCEPRDPEPMSEEELTEIETYASGFDTEHDLLRLVAEVRRLRQLVRDVHSVDRDFPGDVWERLRAEAERG